MWKREEQRKSPSLKSQMEDDVAGVVGVPPQGTEGRAGGGTSERGKERAAAEREREIESRYHTTRRTQRVERERRKDNAASEEGEGNGKPKPQAG